jgi:hypothetical protein
VIPLFLDGMELVVLLIVFLAVEAGRLRLEVVEAVEALVGLV